MSEWQPIETLRPDEYGTGIKDFLLWNGEVVFVGWLSEDGWHDSRNTDYYDEVEDPQPTHWMPLPDPPRE